MADFKQLYKIHQNQKDAVMLDSLQKNNDNNRRKYGRRKIVEADIFTNVERDFLDWLLVEDEYYIDDVIKMIRKEMERVVD